jgi:hypothetical protein
MAELDVKWSMSTIKIFLDNTCEEKIIEFINNKKHLKSLMYDLLDDYFVMLDDFGKDDPTVKRYFVAVNEINEWYLEL